MLWNSFIFFSKPQEVCQIFICGFFSKRGMGYPKSCFYFLGKQFVHKWVYISFSPLLDKIVKTKTMCKGQICAKYSIALSFFVASHSPLPALGESHFLDISLTSCPDNICWLLVLLVRSLNRKVGSLNRSTYIHPQSPEWAGITFPHAKERSGRKWSHFGSGSDIWWRRTGTSLQPQEKDISRRNIKKEIPDHDISTILVYFCQIAKCAQLWK